jgi:hypothetical protein
MKTATFGEWQYGYPGLASDPSRKPDGCRTPQHIGRRLLPVLTHAMSLATLTTAAIPLPGTVLGIARDSVTV